jgi:hypothetical protein
MKLGFDYEADVDVPFSELLADPLLVLRNLPRVDSITKVGDMDYRVVTTPYVVHSALAITGIGHVCLSVSEGKVKWDRSPNHCNVQCNGIITGEASALPDGKTRIQGKIFMIDPRVNLFTMPFIKPIIKGIARSFTDEFIANLNDPVFENDVPG